MQWVAPAHWRDRAHLAAHQSVGGHRANVPGKWIHRWHPRSSRNREWISQVLFTTTRVEDLPAMVGTHPFFDEYWASKVGDWSRNSKFRPMLSRAGATRGRTRAGPSRLTGKSPQSRSGLKFTDGRSGNTSTQMRVWSGKRKFFDCFLKGIKNEVPDWPKVRLEVRDKYYVDFRDEKEFPIAPHTGLSEAVPECGLGFAGHCFCLYGSTSPLRSAG